MKRTPPKPDYEINLESLNEADREIYKKTYDEFEGISIYKLREQARRMGIRAVTRMDKQMLVKSMTEHRIASTVYYPPQKTAVAPVTRYEAEQLTNDYLMKSVVVNPQQRKGILDIAEDGAWIRISGFNRRDADVFVPMLLVNERKLLSGDEISGQVRFMQESGRFGMFKLESINGVRPEAFVRKELSEALPPLGLVRMEKGSRIFNALNTICPLSKGQRKLIIGIGAPKLDALAREISIKMSHRGLETINIFLDETPESISETAVLPGITLSLSCESYEKYDRMVMLALDHAKRIAPHGRHVAIVLNNADVLSEKTLRAVYGAGRFAANGSITSVLLSSALELNAAINLLSRTANSIAIFKNNYADEPFIDITRSFSESEKQLEKAELDTLRDCRKQFERQYVSIKDFMTAYEILLAGNAQE